jgi:hypothetical protein
MPLCKFFSTYFFRPCTVNSYSKTIFVVGGGVFAMDWTSKSITIWHFPRPKIPNDIKEGQPDPDKWEKPMIKIHGACDFDRNFRDQQVFNRRKFRFN